MKTVYLTRENIFDFYFCENPIKELQATVDYSN